MITSVDLLFSQRVADALRNWAAFSEGAKEQQLKKARETIAIL